MEALQFISIATAIGILWYWAWPRIKRPVRFPLAIYIISYTLTYTVGASWIGLTDGSILEYMKSKFIPPSISEHYFEYWTLVFSPYIIPLVTILFFQHAFFNEKNTARQNEIHIGPIQYLLFFVP